MIQAQPFARIFADLRIMATLRNFSWESREVSSSESLHLHLGCCQHQVGLQIEQTSSWFGGYSTRRNGQSQAEGERNNGMAKNGQDVSSSESLTSGVLHMDPDQIWKRRIRIQSTSETSGMHKNTWRNISESLQGPESFSGRGNAEMPPQPVNLFLWDTL
jgi:hypothetical protein